MPISSIGAGTGADAGIKLIFEEIVTSDVSSIDTGTLPTGYKSLRIEIGVRTDRSGHTGDNLHCYFNGDTTAGNYNYFQERYAPGSSHSATSDSRVAQAGAADTVAGYLSGNVLTILDHESSNYGKYWVSHGCSGDSTAREYGYIWSGYWESDAPITSMSFVPVHGSDITAGYVRVYGVK